MNLRQLLGHVAEFLLLLHRAWVAAGQPRLQLTSWFRTWAQNVAAVGLKTSLHLWALAIDVDGSSVDLEAFAEACVDVGLGIEREVTHLHVQLWPRGVGPRPGARVA